MNNIGDQVNVDVKPMVTEDNAEPFMDMIQGFLSLNAYRTHMTSSWDYASVLSGNNYHIIAPAFPAVYGGYYVGFGNEWFRADFSDHDW